MLDWLNSASILSILVEVVEFDLYECVIHLCFGKCVDRFGRGCLGPATDVAASIKDGSRSPSSNFQLMMQCCEMWNIRITPQFYALGLEVSWLHSKCCFMREQPWIPVLPCLEWYSKACREIASTARAVSIMQGSKEKPWDPEKFKLIAREGSHGKSARSTRQKICYSCQYPFAPFPYLQIESGVR